MAEPGAHDAAPWRADLAEGPGAHVALWCRAADGTRLRLVAWPAGGAGRGTVLLFSGRGEYAEKYGRTAALFIAHGWSVLTIDWRGQGFSDRLLADPMIGHVAHFRDYQQDVDAMLAWFHAHGAGAGLSPPLMLLAHSMGGLIGLRALSRHPGIRAAAFTAPMWGIGLSGWRRLLAAGLSRVRGHVPCDRHYAPTARGKSYLLTAEFRDNLLTSDRESWNRLRHQAEAEPAFRLGGPSLGWLRTAWAEARAMAAKPAPAVPALIGLGRDEAIVSPRAIYRRVDAWPGARLLLYAGARHEILMEAAETRRVFVDAVAAHFMAASGGGVLSTLERAEAPPPASAE